MAAKSKRFGAVYAKKVKRCHNEAKAVAYPKGWRPFQENFDVFVKRFQSCMRGLKRR